MTAVCENAPFRSETARTSPLSQTVGFDLAWHAIENLDPRRDDRPGWMAGGEDGEGWMGPGGVVERAGVERVRVGLADLAAEHQAHTVRAAIADRVIAVRRLRMELARFASSKRLESS